MPLAQIPKSSNVDIRAARPTHEQQIHPEMSNAEFFAGTGEQVRDRFKALARFESIDPKMVPQRIETVLRACAAHNKQAMPAVFRVISREYFPRMGAQAVERTRTLMNTIDLMAQLHGSAEKPNYRAVENLMNNVPPFGGEKIFIHDDDLDWCRDQAVQIIEKDLPPARTQSLELAKEFITTMPTLLLGRHGVPMRPVLEIRTMFNTDSAASLGRVQRFIDSDMASIRAFAKDGTFMDPAMPGMLSRSIGLGTVGRVTEMYAKAKRNWFDDWRGLAATLRPYLTVNQVDVDGKLVSFVSGADSFDHIASGGLKDFYEGEISRSVLFEAHELGRELVRSGPDTFDEVLHRGMALPTEKEQAIALANVGAVLAKLSQDHSFDSNARWTTVFNHVSAWKEEECQSRPMSDLAQFVLTGQQWEQMFEHVKTWDKPRPVIEKLVEACRGMKVPQRLMDLPARAKSLENAQARADVRIAVAPYVFTPQMFETEMSLQTLHETLDGMQDWPAKAQFIALNSAASKVQAAFGEVSSLQTRWEMLEKKCSPEERRDRPSPVWGHPTWNNPNYLAYR